MSHKTKAALIVLACILSSIGLSIVVVHRPLAFIYGLLGGGVVGSVVLLYTMIYAIVSDDDE